MFVAKYKVGDKIVVYAKKEELIDIGIIHDNTLNWLLDNKPKIIKEVLNDQLYLYWPKQCENGGSNMIWVYKRMVYRPKNTGKDTVC